MCLASGGEKQRRSIELLLLVTGWCKGPSVELGLGHRFHQGFGEVWFFYVVSGWIDDFQFSIYYYF